MFVHRTVCWNLSARGKRVKDLHLAFAVHQKTNGFSSKLQKNPQP